MKRIKLTKNLYLDEYIPRELYLREGIYGDMYNNLPLNTWMDILQRKINKQMVAADQKLRDQFGAVIINNWIYNGERNYSGYRPKTCSVGYFLSDHREGNASDKIFQDVKTEEVIDYIEKNWEDLGINIIEKGVSWVHTSVAWTDMPLKIIYPVR
jgi:hypothetical protein